MYDIRFIMPSAPSVKKYADRLNDMSKYGIVNIGPYRVLLTILVEDDITSEVALSAGRLWSGVDVEVVLAPYKNVQHKFAWFYVNKFNNAQALATWTARIDDDSSTDVSALMDRLSEFNPCDPLHLIAQQCGNIHNLQHEYYLLLSKYGISREMTELWNHSWEISVDSREAVSRFSRNLQVRAFYRDILQFAQDKVWWTDQAYCYAMRIAGVWPIVVNFLSKDANIRNYTFTGGKYAHVHYVARDLDRRSEFVPKDGVWSEFTKSMEKKFNDI